MTLSDNWKSYGPKREKSGGFGKSGTAERDDKVGRFGEGSKGIKDADKHPDFWRMIAKMRSRGVDEEWKSFQRPQSESRRQENDRSPTGEPQSDRPCSRRCRSTKPPA